MNRSLTLLVCCTVVLCTPAIGFGQECQHNLRDTSHTQVAIYEAMAMVGAWERVAQEEPNSPRGQRVPHELPRYRAALARAKEELAQLEAQNKVIKLDYAACMNRRTAWEEAEGRKRMAAREEAARLDREEAARRVKAAAAEQAYQAEIFAHTTDPAWIRPALSGHICYQLAARAGALGEIATARKLAKRSGGGVINLKEIYDLQQDVLAAEVRAGAVRAYMAKKRLKPMPCSGLVLGIAECLDPNGGSESCKEAPLRDYTDVAVGIEID